MMKFFRKYFFIATLLGFSAIFIIVNIRVNVFRYNNFDFGKFDLGNMTQMVWNVLHGNGLVLTDYFGTNLPRWAMSHVDPILYIFVPIFGLIQHPLTLVFSQIILIVSSAFILFALAKYKLKSDLAGLLVGLSFLLYPAIGFLTAWTGFHGVSVVLPFFLGAFYLFERNYEAGFSKKQLILFWVLVVLTMMGKEQLSAYIALFGLFIVLFRKTQKKLGYHLIIAGTVWLVAAMFIIIPHYSPYRVDGYTSFAKQIGLDGDETRDVSLPNYFLARYDELGDSYGEIVVSSIINPNQSIEIFFGGDKMDNLRQTFEPLGYLPLLFLPILLIAFPDFFANYMTTAGGIGTAEIYNHRISMIIPVLFIATIYAIDYMSWYLEPYVHRLRLNRHRLVLILCFFLLFMNVKTTFSYENPVYLWLTQAIAKRIPVLAANETDDVDYNALQVGDVVRLSELEEKDRQCALKVVEMIPDEASVSGPDYLGAHLAMRETYAIFPALYRDADYVIVDVFAQKILRILDVDVNLVRDVVADVIKDPNYKLEAACGNLFVFKKIGPHDKTQLLPLQNRYEYEAIMSHEIFKSLHVVDFEMPEIATRNENFEIKIVYQKLDNDSLDDYVLFMTFVNEETGEIYQVANIPSFSIIQPREWIKNQYYVEINEQSLPNYLEPSNYKVFVGIGNKVRTRSLYLGDIIVK